MIVITHDILCWHGITNAWMGELWKHGRIKRPKYGSGSKNVSSLSGRFFRVISAGFKGGIFSLQYFVKNGHKKCWWRFTRGSGGEETSDFNLWLKYFEWDFYDSWCILQPFDKNTRFDYRILSTNVQIPRHSSFCKLIHLQTTKWLLLPYRRNHSIIEWTH